MQRQVRPYWIRLLLSVIGLYAVTAVNQVQASDVLTPADLSRLRMVTAASIAPNGKLIAYTLAVPRNPFQDTDGSAWSELHVVNRVGHSRPFPGGGYWQLPGR